MGKLLLLLVVGWGLWAADLADAPKPTLDCAASPAQVAVGDAVTVTMTWTWPAGWQVIHEPDPANDFRDCFVTDAPPGEVSRTAEGERRSFHLTLLANRSGAWALPRPTLAVSGPSGTTTLTAPAVIIQVGTEAAPAHLPPPLALRVRPPLTEVVDQRWWWAAAGAIFVAVGVAAVWWRRRVELTVAVPPSERFAAELGAVAALTDGKELGAAISLAVRRYAGEVYRFDGAGATTREIAAYLAGRTQADDERRDLVRLLERLDSLRWAAGELAVDLVRPLSDEARTWVARVEARLAAERQAEAERTSSARAAGNGGGA